MRSHNSLQVHNGRGIGFTIFHDCAIPPDDFVANCRVQFEDLNCEKEKHDLWVRVYLIVYSTSHMSLDGFGAKWQDSLYVGVARYSTRRCVLGEFVPSQTIAILP